MIVTVTIYTFSFNYLNGLLPITILALEFIECGSYYEEISALFQHLIILNTLFQNRAFFFRSIIIIVLFMKVC